MLEHKDQLVQSARSNIVRFGEYDVAKSPLLFPALEMAGTEPEKILQCFTQYDMVIRHLFNLKPEELRMIREVNTSLGKTRGADEFMEIMLPYKEQILEVVHHAGDLKRNFTKQGVDQLADMMGNAAELKQAEPEWKPTDGDLRSDTVIWGFVNGATDPQTNIDFTLCHGIERIVTQSLRPSGIHYTEHKDWLLSAMTDSIALLGLQGKYPEATLLPRWNTRRPEGLGWISQERQMAYKKFISVPRSGPF